MVLTASSVSSWYCWLHGKNCCILNRNFMCRSGFLQLESLNWIDYENLTRKFYRRWRSQIKFGNSFHIFLDLSNLDPSRTFCKSLPKVVAVKKIMKHLVWSMYDLVDQLRLTPWDLTSQPFDPILTKCLVSSIFHLCHTTLQHCH